MPSKGSFRYVALLAGVVLCFVAVVLGANDHLLSTAQRWNSVPVHVNYDLSLDQMIAADKYNWVDPDIREDRFPVERATSRPIQVELVSFGQPLTSSEVQGKLRQMNLRPATLPELLAMIATYPNSLGNGYIIALSPTWQDRMGFKSLAVVDADEAQGEHKLLLSTSYPGAEPTWRARCRFAAVRE